MLSDTEGLHSSYSKPRIKTSHCKLLLFFFFFLKSIAKGCNTHLHRISDSSSKITLKIMEQIEQDLHSFISQHKQIIIQKYTHTPVPKKCKLLFLKMKTS